MKQMELRFRNATLSNAQEMFVHDWLCQPERDALQSKGRRLNPSL